MGDLAALHRRSAEETNLGERAAEILRHARDAYRGKFPADHQFSPGDHWAYALDAVRTALGRKEKKIVSETPPPDITGPPTIAIVQILSRAKITPFDRMDWSSFTGAEGEACMVEFVRSDFDALRSLLGITHWPADETVVILDNTGITFNYRERRGYAYQAKVELFMDPYDYQVDLYEGDER